MKKMLIWMSLVIILLPVLSACGASAAQTTPTGEATLDQNRMNTAVAATMSVLSTEVAALKATAAAPSATPTPAVSATAGTPAAAAATATSQPRSAVCDFAAFVGDVTIPDGTMIPPNTPFTKTWTVKNIGTCTWTPDYQIVYDGGDLLGSPMAVPMVDRNVAPGETAQISITLTAPPDNKRHYSYWKFRNDKGGVFGVVDVATNEERPVWAEIVVGEYYSFIDNMCLATWKTGSGTLLSCPGDPNATEGGAVYRMNSSQWEGDVYEDEPILVMVPPAGENTTIVGQFPPVIVPQYDWLLTRFGCLADVPDCSATVRITYSVDGGPELPLFEGQQQFDDTIDPINIQLANYGIANKSVSFLFYVTANGEGSDNKIFFFVPRLDPNK